MLKRMPGRRELAYGSPGFLAASDLARQLSNPPRLTELSSHIVRNPPIIPIIADILRLPFIELQVRSTDIRSWDDSYFSPPHGTRIGQAVLDLPTVAEHYLRGRPRQALRTNLSRARETGIASARVPTYEAWSQDMGTIIRARDDPSPGDWERHKPRPGQRVAYYVARDAGEVPLACARVALFGSFGVLFWMLSRSDRHPATSWARYQLHTQLALDLGRSGHRYLLAGPAFRETAGNQYFQHLLGYRARNLCVKVTNTDPAIECQRLAYAAMHRKPFPRDDHRRQS